MPGAYVQDTGQEVAKTSEGLRTHRCVINITIKAQRAVHNPRHQGGRDVSRTRGSSPGAWRCSKMAVRFTPDVGSQVATLACCRSRARHKMVVVTSATQRRMTLQLRRTSPITSGTGWLSGLGLPKPALQRRARPTTSSFCQRRARCLTAIILRDSLGQHDAEHRGPTGRWYGTACFPSRLE